MSGSLEASGNSDSGQVALDQLPRSALQAIYNAVTGKTENYSKNLRGNVKIQFNDVRRLYDQICQQIEHLHKVAEPTVTVVIKSEGSKSLQHSSWAHFEQLQTTSFDVTSELTLKFEILLTLPNGGPPQRLVLTVNLDSSLPVVRPLDREIPSGPFSNFLMIMGERWPTCNISIDFVDFLVAQRFIGTIEKWFDELEKIPCSKLNMYLLKNWQTVKELFDSIVSIGLSIFLLGYVWFAGDSLNRLPDAIVALSLGLIILALSKAIAAKLRSSGQEKITANLLPSVILLTDGDTRRLSEFEAERTKSTATLWSLAQMAVASILLNLAASYLFAYLTEPESTSAVPSADAGAPQ